ncbi:hypothetical protein [Streptomyces sp. NPDC002994]|uniref:hypothetical protein n=1 Tax=Streptomyces sp. NPDC002994 TaxID=3154441 RepID=UPI0033B944AC
MAACKHVCPTCGRHEPTTSITVRVEQLDPTAVAREIRRQLIDLKRTHGLGRDR